VYNPRCGGRSSYQSLTLVFVPWKTKILSVIIHSFPCLLPLVFCGLCIYAICCITLLRYSSLLPFISLGGFVSVSGAWVVLTQAGGAALKSSPCLLFLFSLFISLSSLSVLFPSVLVSSPIYHSTLALVDIRLNRLPSIPPHICIIPSYLTDWFRHVVKYRMACNTTTMVKIDCGRYMSGLVMCVSWIWRDSRLVKGWTLEPCSTTWKPTAYTGFHDLCRCLGSFFWKWCWTGANPIRSAGCLVFLKFAGSATKVVNVRPPELLDPFAPSWWRHSKLRRFGGSSVARGWEVSQVEVKILGPDGMRCELGWRVTASKSREQARVGIEYVRTLQQRGKGSVLPHHFVSNSLLASPFAFPNRAEWMESPRCGCWATWTADGADVRWGVGWSGMPLKLGDMRNMSRWSFLSENSSDRNGRDTKDWKQHVWQ